MLIDQGGVPETYLRSVCPDRAIPHRTKPPKITTRVLWRTIVKLKVVVQVEARIRETPSQEKS